MTWYQKLGPGLLYAGAAIGVSHLVQSTRAGALYGFDLALIILIVNLLKYPFFEASVRFVTSQKKNLLEGYYSIHPIFLFIFLLQTFCTMFIVQAAVTTVTSGLFINFFGFSLSPFWVSALILGALSLVLLQNKVSLLNQVMKPVMLILVLCTLAAFFMALTQIEDGSRLFEINFDFSNKTDLYFLAALIGWMPSPLDASVWHSVWALDEIKQENKRIDKEASLFDLRFSYGLIIFLAFVFLSLGALLMHTEGKTFSTGAVAFSSDLVGLYEKSLGTSASIIISLACLMTMISTTLTCWDAFARLMSEGTCLLMKKKMNGEYQAYLLLIALGSLVLIKYFLFSMKALVDFATVVAFMMGPLVGFLSLVLMLQTKDQNERIFPTFLKISAGISCTLMALASLWYLYLVS